MPARTIDMSDHTFDSNSCACIIIQPLCAPDAARRRSCTPPRSRAAGTLHLCTSSACNIAVPVHASTANLSRAHDTCTPHPTTTHTPGYHTPQQQPSGPTAAPGKQQQRVSTAATTQPAGQLEEQQLAGSGRCLSLSRMPFTRPPEGVPIPLSFSAAGIPRTVHDTLLSWQHRRLCSLSSRWRSWSAAQQTGLTGCLRH